MTTHNDRFNDLIYNTQSIATDLLEFQPYVPNAANISALGAELVAISASLQELRAVSSDPRNLHDTRYYADARWAVTEAFKQTLVDLDRFLRRKDTRTRSKRELYSTIWTEFNEFFIKQSNNTLFDRLNCFKLFLEDLVVILRGGRESRDFEHHYERIDSLVSIQDEDLSQQLRRLELQRDAIATPAKVKSWERKRPEHAKPRARSPPIAPQAPTAPAGIHRNHPASPVSPSGPRRFWDNIPDPPVPVSLPTSPASTAPPSSGSSSSDAGSDMENHWLRAAFMLDRPNTNFEMTSTESALFDRHTSGVTDQLRRNKYAEILILRFDNNLEVRIYIRDKDRKARIYCKYEKLGKRTVSCRPITSLHIHRQDSNLQLYELDKDKKNRMWLILKFPSYERMILFFCAFLALKMEDQSLAYNKPVNHILPEEKHVFSCIIHDDHYKHALQIFKDQRSEGIRLQASVLRGEKRTTPVWTAFINYKICALRWISRPEPHKIHLTDLPRYVFSNDYTPHMGPNGEYELHFEDVKDADKFEQVIENLAEGNL